MPKYKLIYFHGRGRAENARLLFAAADVQYEDVRVSKDNDWPNIKDKTPLGHAPVLEIDGVQYGSSTAISRYLAEEFGFYGKNSIERLQIGQVVDTLEDMMSHIYRMVRMTDEEKVSAKEKFIADVLKPHFAKLNALIGDKNYFVGDSMTLADIALFHFIDQVHKRIKDPTPEEREEHGKAMPGIRRVFENVSNNPRIKKWVETRPVTPM